MFAQPNFELELFSEIGLLIGSNQIERQTHLTDKKHITSTVHKNTKSKL
jgi:hypothetical protein